MAVLRCLEPFVYHDKDAGIDRVIRAGDLVDADDPAIKGREQYFESVERTVERATVRAEVIEAASKAPGEKRSTRKTADEPAAT